MAEIDDVRAQIAQAAASGDDATVARLSTRYRDLQASAGQLPVVGRGFVAQNGREFQLAQRAMTLRRAGRDNEATDLIRVIARERYARNLTANGGGRTTAALFGANRGIFNLGTLVNGGRELVEDTLGGNRNGRTAQQSMEDLSAVSDAVTARHPVSAAAGEVGGAALTLAIPGSGGATVARNAPRVARVARAVATGAGYGGVQGASDAAVRGQDVAQGAERGAGAGAATGGTLSVLGQVLAPVLRAAGNRLADNQGLRLLAEHLNPQQLNAVVAAVRQYQRQFGSVPTLAEATGMVDQTISREAGQIVETQVPASQIAQQGADRIRIRHQRDLAEAVMPTSSTSGRVTTDTTNRAMQAIQGSAIVARQGTPLHDFLTRPNVTRAIRSMPPEQRALFDTAIDNGGPVSVRMLDDLRLQVGDLSRLKGADYAWTDVANEARRFADEATNGAYGRVIRVHGQNALREGIANEALRSPAAARRVAGDLAESASQARDLTAELGPAEAARIRNAGATIQRAGNGVEEFRPAQALSRGEAAAANVAETARAALLPKTGGAGTASFIARNVRRLGITQQEAERFARDFTDPSQTQRAIQFLQQRLGNGPANNFMRMLEAAGIRPTVERVGAVGARLAANGPNTNDTPTDELLGAPAPADQPNTAEPTSLRASDVSNEFLDRLAQVESGGNANAQAATSSAAGAHQFIDSTWLATIRAHADELGLQRVAQHIDAHNNVADPEMRARILALRTDPVVSREVARAFTADNLNGLQSALGREPTVGEVYAAHLLGLGGARRLIAAAGRNAANAAQIFPREARANRNIFYNNGRARSAAEVMQLLESKWD